MFSNLDNYLRLHNVLVRAAVEGVVIISIIFQLNVTLHVVATENFN